MTVTPAMRWYTRLITPALVLALPLAAVWWAFLDELTHHAERDPQFDLLALATGTAPADFERLLNQIDRLAQREINICGPAPMVNALLPRLHQYGVDPKMIHYERFDFR